MLHEAGALFGVLGAHIVGQQDVDRPAEQFLAPVAEQAFDFTVDHYDGAAAADDDHAARAGLDRQSEYFRS